MPRSSTPGGSSVSVPDNVHVRGRGSRTLRGRLELDQRSMTVPRRYRRSALGRRCIVLLAPRHLPSLVAQSPPAGSAAARRSQSADARAASKAATTRSRSLTAKLDPQDPHVAALRARAPSSRAAAIRKPKRCCGPVAQRAPTSEAALELGLLLQMLGRSGGRPRSSTRVAAAATGDRRRPSSLAPRARCARSAAPGSERRLSRCRGAGADAIPRSTPPGAICSSRSIKNDEALKSFRDGARGRSEVTRRRSSARRARWPTTIRRRRSQLAKKALEINPSDVDAHVFLADEAVDAGDARRGAQVAAEGARR